MKSYTPSAECSVVISAVQFIHTSFSEGGECVLSFSDTAQRGQYNTSVEMDALLHLPGLQKAVDEFKSFDSN